MDHIDGNAFLYTRVRWHSVGYFHDKSWWCGMGYNHRYRQTRMTSATSLHTEQMKSNHRRRRPCLYRNSVPVLKSWDMTGPKKLVTWCIGATLFPIHERQVFLLTLFTLQRVILCLPTLPKCQKQLWLHNCLIKCTISWEYLLKYCFMASLIVPWPHSTLSISMDATQLLFLQSIFYIILQIVHLQIRDMGSSVNPVGSDLR